MDRRRRVFSRGSLWQRRRGRRRRGKRIKLNQRKKIGNTSGAGEELIDLVIFLKQQQKKKSKEKKHLSKKSPFEYLRTDRSALSCCQKMRGLNPDRHPCVQGSIRGLGFNFTDWFAPFSSVRIITRKVASAEPLYFQVCNRKKKMVRRRVGVVGRTRSVPVSMSVFYVSSEAYLAWLTSMKTGKEQKKKHTRKLKRCALQNWLLVL